MPITEYKFTVKEGDVTEDGSHSRKFLMCEPENIELMCIGDNAFLSIHLKENTSIEQAKDVAKYLQENIAGFSVTNLSLK